MIAAHDDIFRRTVHALRRRTHNVLLHVLGRAQRSVARHESHATGIGSEIDRREIGVCRNHPDTRQIAAQYLGHNLRSHGVRTLANLRCAGIDDHAAIAIDLDVHRRVRHVGANNAVGCAAHVMAARYAQPTSLRQLALALFPSGSRNDLIDALRQSIAQHAQAIHRDGRRLQQVHAPHFGRIEFELGRDLVHLRLEGKAHVDGAVPAHSAAGRLVGQHAIAVVTNVRNVVQRAQQRAGIKNRYHTVGAIAAAILVTLQATDVIRPSFFTPVFRSTMVRGRPRCAQNTSSRV